MSDITYATIIPLIGGESIGAADALHGQLPEYVLSYSPFVKNDSHYINYLKTQKNWTGKYYLLDRDENLTLKYVDVVNSVCPCAGLSSLSSTASTTNPANDWMYKSAEYVLGKLAPKVFWGENAPRLFLKSGKTVADNLYEIGKKHGYSLTLYHTESQKHGMSQKRPRTYYFFVKGKKAPILKTWRRKIQDIEETFARDAIPNDAMNIAINAKDPADNPWTAYAIAVTGATDVKDLYNKFEKSQNLIVFADGHCGKTLNDAAEWMEAQDNDLFRLTAARARRMHEKVKQGLGYWAHGETLLKGVIPTFIGAMPWGAINPISGKYLTIRECLRIMSMPDDFNLYGDNPVACSNHICQNVSPTVAKDMMENVISILENKCAFADCDYVKQSNTHLKNVNGHTEFEILETTIEDFM
jgi:site-specific DNA-cytosine methylase